jgi:hypothetical protein
MIARGLIPNSSAFSLLINTNAEAPSFNVDAFAAVTVPSFLKTGFKAGILSNLTALYSSSSATTVTPALPSISTGTISFLNRPFSLAA